MSFKITVIPLQGRPVRGRSRCRAQRLVDAGTHEWVGAKTIREIRQAKAVSPLHNITLTYPQYEFDVKYPGPGMGPLPGDHPLPYTYPLPLDILIHYQSSRLA